MVDESEYCKLRKRLSDDLIKRDFDLYYANQPSLYLLLCLKSAISLRDLHLHSLRWKYTSVAQLTDWNKEEHQKVIDLFRLNIFPHHSWNYTEILPEFLHDASRAGKYTLNAETYASSSLSSLEYLSRSRLGTPINLWHSRSELPSRRNSPWHWRKHMKYLKSLHVLQSFKYGGKLNPENTLHLREDLRPLQFPKLYSRMKRQETYIDATYIALKCLPELLRRSAKSKKLVTFLTAEKPFNPRAFQFPGHVKKCKAAIDTYVGRVQQQPETQSCAAGLILA